MSWKEFKRGAVYNDGRYRQGYDHTPWIDILPRNITPSDIDAVFDNMLHQRSLFCDFSSEVCLWKDKNLGQRLVYQQQVLGSQYKHCSILCYHEVPIGTDINSALDVKSFHVMKRSQSRVVFLPDHERCYDGELWLSFVQSFYGQVGQWDKWWNSDGLTGWLP